MADNIQTIESLARSLRASVLLNVVLALALLFGAIFSHTGWPDWDLASIFKPDQHRSLFDPNPGTPPDSMTLAVARQISLWQAPNAEYAARNDTGDLIRYGRDLIARTAAYLGPRGSVAQITNGMNCQNCHLDAGTKAWGNNYGAVAPTYPKFRERSGATEDLFKRVSDCMERSLNGRALPLESREMQAMITYINWLGSAIPKKEVPNGAGIYNLSYLDRPADPEKGKKVYAAKCQNCHAPDGQGLLDAEGIVYLYPPLWGPHHYNIGAGLYRLSRFAGYAKYNMPFGATYQKPQLSDEEAWDVAAFVNSQPRPGMDISADWPNLLGKPPDHPFGPYADGFSEKQHKYGPFQPIKEKIAALKKQQKKEVAR